MPRDLVLLSTFNGSNYPCLELIFMVPKEFEPLKFDCISTATADFLNHITNLKPFKFAFFEVALLQTNDTGQSFS